VSFAQAVALMSIVALISILSLIPGGIGVSRWEPRKCSCTSASRRLSRKRDHSCCDVIRLSPLPWGLDILGSGNWSDCAGVGGWRQAKPRRTNWPPKPTLHQLGMLRQGTVASESPSCNRNYIPCGRDNFDLINSVDEFILYDTAQFTKNDMAQPQQDQDAARDRLVDDPRCATTLGNQSRRRESAIRLGAGSTGAALLQNYAKAPHFREYMPAIRESLPATSPAKST